MSPVFKALSRLRPGALFRLDGDTLTGVTWETPGVVPVTQDELDSMLAVIQEEQAALAYRIQRAAEYPTVGDQLDDLYKRGAFSPEMTARIKAVKDKYPKPSSV